MGMKEPGGIKQEILKLMASGNKETAAELLRQLEIHEISEDSSMQEKESQIIESLANTTVRELLGRFPSGFSVSPSGRLFEILAAVSSLPVIAENFPIPPPNGGYIVVSAPTYVEGDEIFGIEKENK